MVLANTKTVWFEAPHTSQDHALSAAFPNPALLPTSIFTAQTKALGQRIEPLLPGDPAIGNAIYHGEFKFGAVEIRCRGTLIFNCSINNRHWRVSLHGFAWLQHIRATGRELNRLHARALISDWIAQKRQGHSAANATAVMNRRVMSWITCAHYLSDGAGDVFQENFFTSLAKQVRDLHLRLFLPGSAGDRLGSALALAYASVGLLGLEATRPMAFSILGSCLDRQILPDGGHVSRNPQNLVRLLLDLLPLRLACDCARIELPSAVHGAIERMIPMLRFFKHGDGGTAIFHGASDSMNRECAAILESDEVQGKPVQHASHSGYGRLSGGAATIICDLGKPPDIAINPLAAASPLAFEFSDAGNRIVMNCGCPPVEAGNLQEAGRRVEAHSTVTLNSGFAGSKASGILSRIFGRSSINRDGAVSARCETCEIGSIIDARSETQNEGVGIIHERLLFLATAGTDFRGEDRLSAGASGADLPFAIRFHLHPSVKATETKDGAGAILLTEDRSAWKFSARGGQVRIEESIRIWGEAGARKTSQIIVRGIVGGSARVQWAFRKIEKERPATEPLTDNGELPF